MIAVYSPTGEKGKTVIVGYLNKNQLAAVGEFRAYSTNAQGALQTYVWLKADGDILLGGDAFHLTKFEQMETAYNALKADLNNLVIAFNAHTHAYTAPSGAAVTGTATPSGVASSASMATAKTDKVKTL